MNILNFVSKPEQPDELPIDFEGVRPAVVAAAALAIGQDQMAGIDALRRAPVTSEEPSAAQSRAFAPRVPLKRMPDYGSAA